MLYKKRLKSVGSVGSLLVVLMLTGCGGGGDSSAVLPAKVVIGHRGGFGFAA